MVAIYCASAQANHTIPFMFGNVSVCGNLCDSVITCVAPPLPPGHHAVHMAFNQQSFQPVQIDGHPVYFEAFPPPQVAPPDAAHASVQFGPTCGGTPLEIQGHGFVATSDSVTLVQFWFSHESNVVVPGTVVNAHVVTCVTPRVDRVGRAVVLVSCNGQQFSDAPHHLTFEFHAPTVVSVSAACPHSGSLRGGTAIQFHVVSGLPQDLSHVDAVVNVVERAERSMIRTTPAAFDRSSRTLSFITPAWPYPAHVAFDLSLNKGTFFVPTCMSFLYYSPPPPIRGICPAAGPVGGRTWVEVECPGVVDTGEVTFKLTPIQSSDEDQDILQPPVDYGAPIQVQFTPWGNPNLAVIVSGSVLCDSNNNKTIECLLTQGSLEAGYCRVELSLNGQQFSATEYPDPRHVSPLHVVYRRLLFPFRVFVPPFFVATTFGSAGGGSRVLICGGHKLVKYVTRGDGKCHVQLTPVRLLGQMTAKLPDKVMVAAQNALDVDDSYLLFLYYTPPQITSIWPTSSCADGGGVLRLKGVHVMDHGGVVSVVMSSSNHHRKVRGFIQEDTLMCCAPAFPVGYCQVFVSFNDQQYTKCSFPCRQSSFLYFQAPAISHVSPVCSPSHVGSTVLIRGIELVDTGTIQLRFTYADDRDGRHVTQIVPGKLNQDGAIVCQTPVLKVSQSMVYSRLDLSLNGCEYTDVGRPFYFYSQHKLTKVEPSGMALELPTSQRLYLSPEIVSDGIQLRLHVSYRMSPSEPVTMSVLGPVDATTAEWIDWECPPLVSAVSSPAQL
ncbi:hypothetical protein DYB31_012405, partial [Aphanomyces astaci]